METKKLNCSYVQLFPRTVEQGLAPKHVEESDFMAECSNVEGLGDVWLLHQQHAPHIVAQVQFTKDEADFDRLLGRAMGAQILHDFIRGDATFFCMLSAYNANEIPPSFPASIKSKVHGLSAATRWWHEYREKYINIK